MLLSLCFVLLYSSVRFAVCQCLDGWQCRNCSVQMWGWCVWRVCEWVRQSSANSILIRWLVLDVTKQRRELGGGQGQFALTKTSCVSVVFGVGRICVCTQHSTLNTHTAHKNGAVNETQSGVTSHREIQPIHAHHHQYSHWTNAFWPIVPHQIMWAHQANIPVWLQSACNISSTKSANLFTCLYLVFCLNLHIPFRLWAILITFSPEHCPVQ